MSVSRDSDALEVAFVPGGVPVHLNVATLESLPQVFGVLLEGQKGRIRTKRGEEMEVMFTGYDTANGQITFVPVPGGGATAHGAFFLTDIEWLEFRRTTFIFPSP